MIFSRWKRWKEPQRPIAATTPPDMRIYAIGDVHGRDDLLQEISEQIEKDLASAPPQVLTVLLGDYVDRGPHSANVVERLAAGRFPTQIKALRGNHELLFLQFLDNPAVLGDWRKVGGLETLHSYGVDIRQALRGKDLRCGASRTRQELPTTHRRFLEATELSATFGDYFFCHAGVRPDVPLESQSPEDLMWIRAEFLRSERPFGKTVVHGHTPVAEPEIKSNRINIDTGAFATSALTCLVLEGPRRRFLTTDRGARADLRD